MEFYRNNTTTINAKDTGIDRELPIYEQVVEELGYSPVKEYVLEAEYIKALKGYAKEHNRTVVFTASFLAYHGVNWWV